MYHRLFQSQDFERCVPLLPQGLDMSAKVRAALPSLWRRLHAAGQLHGGVVADAPEANRILSFGMFVFLEEDFVVDLLRSPAPYLSSRVYDRIRSRRSPVLSSRAIAAANAGNGLNLAILHFGIARTIVSAEEERTIALTSQTGFRLCSMGYRLSRVVQEAYGVAELPFFIAGGFLVKSDYEAFYARHPQRRPGPDRQPQLMGLFRTDRESRFPGNALSDLFQPLPEPRIKFSPGEQRVLLCAVMDESDEIIAKRFAVSNDAVKKTWRRIHQRVVLRAPRIVDEMVDVRTVRGKERRRRLLQYLRYHPEELRPFVTGGNQ
jgi:hypothetical protein